VDGSAQRGLAINGTAAAVAAEQMQWTSPQAIRTRQIVKEQSLGGCFEGITATALCKQQSNIKRQIEKLYKTKDYVMLNKFQ